MAHRDRRERLPPPRSAKRGGYIAQLPLVMRPGACMAIAQDGERDAGYRALLPAPPKPQACRSSPLLEPGHSLDMSIACRGCAAVERERRFST